MAFVPIGPGPRIHLPAEGAVGRLLGATTLELVLLGVALAGIHLTAAYSYLLFHSLVELFSICIGVAVFIITVNCWNTIRNPYVQFVGLLYLFVSILDFLHLLSYKGMSVFPDYDYYAPQFWVAARLLEAAGMLLAFSWVGTQRRVRPTLAAGVMAVITAALVASILVTRTFPVCFVPGQGLTTFKIGSEYVICGLLLASAAVLHASRSHFDARVYRLIALSIGLMVLTELCFTRYASDAMSDAFNEAGHLLKVGAFYALYKALVVTGLRDPIRVLFRELRQSETRLAEAQRLAQLGTWRWDLVQGLWSWSGEINRFAALPPQTPPAAEALTRALAPQSQEALATALRAGRDEGRDFDLLLTTAPVAGAARVGQMRGRALRGPGGAVVALSGTLQDLTESHRTMRVTELASEKEKFETLLQTCGDGIHVFDALGNVVEVNDKFCRMLGYSREEMLRMNVAQWDAHFSAAELEARLAQNLAQESVFETRHRCRDGSVLDVEICANAVVVGGRILIWNAARDITERKRTQSRLMLAASVFTHASEGILITDAQATLLEVNEAFTRITGYSHDEAVGRNPRFLQSGRQPPDFYREMWRELREKGHWAGELWNARKDGGVFAEALTITAVHDDEGHVRNYVGMLTDITHLKEHEKRLERMAHYDALTGLPNRVLASDRLQQAMHQVQRRGNAVAVAFLDIDGFKAVNDRYGHGVGDECLIAMARAMRSSLREGDTLARLGGDEFLAVLGDLTKFEDCEPILRRLLRAASMPLVAGQHVLKLSASIGVTLYPQDGGTDPDQLIRHADQAMYQAKQAGKNRFHLFDVEQDVAVRVQREGVEQVRAAIGREEFVLHYQPKVNMRSGRVVGVEALIRWQHPERGLVPPAEFLPLVEDHPVGVELGEWVLATALAQAARWHDAGLDLQVSVNVAAVQLLESNFPDRLDQLLARHPQLRPAALELEIVETSALDNLSRVSELMRACSAIGVGFALDDFGTGYSSLSYLKHLPVDLIKIDQSFVRDLLSDPADLAVVRAVIALSQAFGRRVIAEGVETVEHGSQLLLLGCELGQGYGIARPMAAEAVQEWVAHWRPDPTWVR